MVVVDVSGIGSGDEGGLSCFWLSWKACFQACCRCGRDGCGMMWRISAGESVDEDAGCPVLLLCETETETETET